MKFDKTHLARHASMSLAILLSACGGGGGDSGTSNNSSAGSFVTGTLVGPVGSQVTLQNNGGDNLGVTVGPFGTDDYAQQSFSFATAQASGSAYSVSLLSQPAGQSCLVYKGATGTLPLASGALKAGCEYNYDLVSRSTNDAVLSSAVYNHDTTIGGASVAIGNTATAYGEGRFVAFVSYAPNLATGATGTFRQVFWHDKMTGETRLISADGLGNEGNGDSWAPSISADGLSVAFESYASNLANADTNGVRDVFVWKLNSGLTRIVGSLGEGNAASFEPSISGDGTVVAFTSYASNLGGTVAGTTNANVYRSVLSAGTCTLVSHANASASEGNFGSSKPSISEDGTRIAFWSYASDLTASDTNGLWDIFVYDSTSGTNTRVSLANGGTERNQGGDSISGIVPPTISGNGRYVAYSTLSTDVVANDTNGARDVFVVDTQTSGASLSVVRASVSSTGTEGDGASPIAQGDRIALSYDGNLVAFNTAATNLGTSSFYNVVVRNGTAASTSVVTATGGSTPSYVSISRSGSYVNFLSGAVGLDSRFNSSGVYTRFTGLGRAWAWID